MERIYYIENEYLRLAVSSRGAEMRSLYHKPTKREQLWQRDASLWGDSAPWLFPVIGQLRNGVFQHEGQLYALPLHGFASQMDFALTAHTVDTLELSLSHSEQTQRNYPFPFMLVVRYRLRGSAVSVEACVHNPGTRDMFFALGAHPGFQCAEGDTLHFLPAGSALLHELEPETHLLVPRGTPISVDALPLSASLFARDALLLSKPTCSAVHLARRDGTGVRVDFGHVPWLGLWSRPIQPLRYLCIEPWFGVDDDTDADGKLCRKRDIQRLAPGESFRMDLTITPA